VVQGRGAGQNIEALFALGQLHDLDGRTRSDAEQALDYYIRTARQGHSDARQILRAKLAGDDAPGRERLLALLEGDWEIYGAELRVKGSKVNIRQGPGTRHSLIIALAEGAPLVGLEMQGKWRRVGVAGHARLGWVHAPLVQGPPQ
jgi:TPR repeat protein